MKTRCDKYFEIKMYIRCYLLCFRKTIIQNIIVTIQLTPVCDSPSTVVTQEPNIRNRELIEILASASSFFFF